DHVEAEDLPFLRVEVQVPAATAIGDVGFDGLGSRFVLRVKRVALAASQIDHETKIMNEATVHSQVLARTPEATAHAPAEEIAVDDFGALAADGPKRWLSFVLFLVRVPLKVAHFETDVMGV